MVWAGIDTMDVSFSAWKLAKEGKGPLQLKGESFSFLFDRRYTNRLNRMSRVFFEAYAKATAELSVSEDRFPSLSEVETKMEGGAIYAFKDRLMKNTEFFDEVKISGVSYLIPRASHFVDSSGVYTDLIFDFEAGTVTLPSRRKVPLLPKLEVKPAAEEEAAGEAYEEERPAVSEVGAREEAPEIEAAEEAPTPEEVSLEKEAPATPPKHDVAESLYEEVEEAVKKPSEEQIIPEKTAELRAAETVEEKRARYSRREVGLVLLALLLLIGMGAFFIYVPLTPNAQVEHIMYTAYLSNDINESALTLDIENPAGIEHNIELRLPENIDRAVSAKGGTVTVSHSGGTVVRMSSSSDSSIKVDLSEKWQHVPVVLSIAVPEDYDSGIVVHGKSYEVSKKDNELVLRLNVTSERVKFDQSYMRKR